MMLARVMRFRRPTALALTGANRTHNSSTYENEDAVGVRCAELAAAYRQK